jgi:hypothetical protein
MEDALLQDFRYDNCCDFGFVTFAGKGTMPQKQAISAVVTGDDQHVGFRAMVLKQAIAYNLAGPRKMTRT